MTNDEMLKVIIKNIRETSFVRGYDASDEECLGIAIAHFFQWNGKKIMLASAEALQDANFHQEAEQLFERVKKFK